MGKIFNAVATGILAGVVSGCLSMGAIQMTPSPGQSFNDNGRIYLHAKSPDIVGIQDALEHRLLKAGYQVKPEIFVRSSDKYVIDARKGKSREKDYVLEYSYHSRRTFLIRRLVIDKFDAKLTNLENGKKVMELKFEGKMSPGAFLDEFMKKLETIRR